MKRMKYIWAAAGIGIMGMSAAASEIHTVQEEETEVQAHFEVSQQVAAAGEMAAVQEVVQDWMVPVYADELRDGVYEIKADSSSSMFSIEGCQLTVKDGKMTALMTLGGKGYLKVFMGTGEEAVQAEESEYISFVEAEDGRHTYEVPIEALDCGTACAAFSKKREKWYDRTIVFLSSSLPLDAFKNPPITTWEDLQLEDGTYLIDVVLDGETGKAKVESPAQLYVEDGLMMAEIVFGSSNYDYVIVEEEKCLLLSEEGNSSFLIPVIGFDYAIPIKADSVALGKPRELDYTIRFASASVTEAAEQLERNE